MPQRSSGSGVWGKLAESVSSIDHGYRDTSVHSRKEEFKNNENQYFASDCALIKDRNSLYVRKECLSICMRVCVCWSTCSKRQTWKEVRERWRWKKTAVRHLLCNSARGCSVRHNSPPSTQCYSNCRNASAARYWIWNDSKRTEWNRKKEKCCIVTEANHRIASKYI